MLTFKSPFPAECSQRVDSKTQCIEPGYSVFRTVESAQRQKLRTSQPVLSHSGLVPCVTAGRRLLRQRCFDFVFPRGDLGKLTSETGFRGRSAASAPALSAFVVSRVRLQHSCVCLSPLHLQHSRTSLLICDNSRHAGTFFYMLSSVLWFNRQVYLLFVKKTVNYIYDTNSPARN